MNADVDKTDAATTPSPSQSLIVTTNPLTNLVLVPLVQLYPARPAPPASTRYQWPGQVPGLWSLHVVTVDGQAGRAVRSLLEAAPAPPAASTAPTSSFSYS